MRLPLRLSSTDSPASFLKRFYVFSRCEPIHLTSHSLSLLIAMPNLRFMVPWLDLWQRLCRSTPLGRPTLIMENQMEKNMENEMETGIIEGYIGVTCLEKSYELRFRLYLLKRFLQQRW